MAAHVVVIEDDPDVLRLVATLLRQAGHTVTESADARSGLRALHEQRADLVVLDIGLPGLDGWEALERIRDMSEVAVLVLTARDQELEKVRALRAGADDYVTKPFGRQELVARVDALLRRTGGVEPPLDKYESGALQIDYTQQRALFGGRDLSLTPQEFRLLDVFVKHPRHVLSGDQLAERAWNDTELGAGQRVRVYVGYLRQKLGLDPSPIETVRGFGYRFSPEP